MRAEMSQYIGENMKAELAPFSFSLKDGQNSIEIRNKAICFVPDLWRKIEEMLSMNDNDETG